MPSSAPQRTPHQTAPGRWAQGWLWLVAGAASAWAVAATVALGQRVSGHAANVVDFLPLWLGGRALLLRTDPTDPQVSARLFRLAQLPMEPGGFASYYPQTASFLCAPLGYFALEGPFARGLQVVLGLALLSGVALGGAADLRGPRLLLVMALAVGLTASLPISWLLLNMGQSNTLLVLLVGAGIAAMARRRDGLAGVAIGLGIAIKLFPAVLLIPALLDRRWRVVGLALLVPAALMLLSLGLYHGPWVGSPWGGGAAGFVAARARTLIGEHAMVDLLWPLRGWLLGLGTLGLTAWGGWRRPAGLAPALAALWLAWVGAVMAGGAISHQGVVMLPAAAWLLGWPLATSRRWLAALVLCLVGAVAWQAEVFVAHQVRTMQWLPVCFAVWAGCALRVVDALVPVATRPVVAPAPGPRPPQALARRAITGTSSPARLS